MANTVSVATPHVATVSFDARVGSAVTRSYTSPVLDWGTTDGWTVVGGGTITAGGLDRSLVASVTGASGTYLTKTRAAGSASDWLRVRALVRLRDPEARPTLVYISDATGQGGQPWGNYPLVGDWARLISGDLVMIEGWVPASTTVVRINVAKPTGATSIDLLVDSVWFDSFSQSVYQYAIYREDANGTKLVKSHRDLDGDPAAGFVTFVDREASLTGPVTWRFRNFVSPTATLLATLAATLTSTGYAVIHRVHLASSTVHAVTLLAFSSGRASRAVPLEVVDDVFPVVPLGPLSARAGRFSCRFDTFDAAGTFLDDLAAGEVAMLRQTVTTRKRLDCYFVPTSLDIDRADVEGVDGPLWDVSGTFLETARGTG